MATAGDRLYDMDVRHQIGLARYSTGTVRQILALLGRVEADIVEKIEKLSWEEVARNSTKAARLKAMLEAIKSASAEGATVILRALKAELGDLATYEVEFQHRAVFDIGVGLAVKPRAEQLRAATFARPFQGRLLREWVSELDAASFRRLRDAIRIGYLEGESIASIVKRVRGTRALDYRDGIMEISRRGAEAMVRTAITHTASAAKEEFFAANPSAFRGVRWSSVIDSRTTAVCRARDGKVYPLGEGPRPPAHIRCLPGDALVSSRHRISGASKRWYDGQLVVISTASGKHLASTPNHPILTARGWVASGLICEGYDVVCDGFAQADASGIDVNDQHMPTRIEEIAEATFRSGEMLTRPVPTTAEDFHGDALDGDIAVIAADRFLADRLKTSRHQHSGQRPLVSGNVRLPLFSAASDLAAIFLAVNAATNGLMRVAGECASFFIGQASHAGALLLGPISQGNAFAFEDAFNRPGRYAEVTGNTGHSRAGTEHRRDLSGRQVESHWRIASGFPQVFEVLADEATTDAVLAGDILSGSAGPIFLDQVVRVEAIKFAGHVYNLETATGFYVANGIITHNCRSTTVAVLKGEPDPPESETYQGWLKRQPPELQDDILGKSKGRLFREGGLTLDRFVDRAGKELTLDQLRRVEAEAFEKAGLSA